MTRQFHVDVRRVNAKDRFLSRLAGVTDPETKRKIIGEEFIRVFEAEAKKIGAVDFLAQGTIYPDVVESGLGGESVVIKSHHNVGGLPDCVDFKDIVEPLRRLFKDEVRQLGIELGLPEQLVWRQPFPGPGLAIRVIGEITDEKLEILRDADAIFREEMALAGLDRTTSQYFAVLTSVRSVGVMGDRPIDYVVINHMEPDHSGSLSLLRKYYPNVKVVGNKKTFDMLHGFYHIDDNRLEVCNGTTLSLGHHNLQFFLTPMVHWPETMMTYDATDHVIFSGDAFGCFGALNGGIIDSEIDTEWCWLEMTRYYSNIVGKYGVPVQNALKKLGCLQLDYICSPHGPLVRVAGAIG